MQCERAQEFFSDYLERTLDRPMTVALESHLGSCARCREEVEGLQEMMLVLDTVPEVEPPWDGAWQVMARIRNARAAELEAQRPRTLTFFQWLRSLSPASVAVATGLATLVVAGTVMIPGVQHTIQNAIGGRIPTASGPGVNPVSAGELPAVQASYHPETRQLDLLVTPVSDLPGAQAKLDYGGKTVQVSDGFGLGPQRPLKQPIWFQDTGREAEALWMTVSCPARNKQFRYLIVVPLKQRTDEPVKAFLENRPVEEALRQIAPHLGRPVVMSGAVDGSVSLSVDGESGPRCLDEIARQVRARSSSEADAYHLTAAP